MEELTLVAYKGDKRDRTSFIMAGGSAFILLFLGLLVGERLPIAGDIIAVIAIIGVIIFIFMDYRSLGKQPRGCIYVGETRMSIQFDDAKTTLPAREVQHIYFTLQTDFPGNYQGGLSAFKSSPSKTLNFLRILHKGEYYSYSVNLPEDRRPDLMYMLHQYRLSGIQVDIQE